MNFLDAELIGHPNEGNQRIEITAHDNAVQSDGQDLRSSFDPLDHLLKRIDSGERQESAAVRHIKLYLDEIETGRF